MPTLLEGEAIAVWFDLTTEEQATYKTAKEKIVEQMTPACFMTLADFHRSSLRPVESLSVYAHELKQLLEQALSAADANTSKQLLHHFINGLPAHLSKQLHAVGEVTELKAAMERAKLLMTLEQEQEVSAAVQSSEVTRCS